MTTSAAPPPLDDRVLPTTRLLSTVILPILVVAFCVLYPVPTVTKELFAWEIKPTMTPMVLASAYIGGAWFFFRARTAVHWRTVKVGFVPVAVFASTLGLATLIHWNKFNHGHLAFWLWSGLYFSTPFLVVAALLRNRKVEAPPAPDELRLDSPARAFIGLTGVASLALGAFLWLAPATAKDVWPWAITPLTGRVVGSVLLLGVAGIAIALDPRWSVARLMLQVQRLMVALILVGAARAHAEMDTGRPLTWMLGIGLLTLLVASALLDRSMQRRVAA